MLLYSGPLMDFVAYYMGVPIIPSYMPREYLVLLTDDSDRYFNN